SYALPESQTSASCWVLGMRIPPTLDRVIEALHPWRYVLGNHLSPELRSKSDDEVQAAGGGPGLTDRGEGRGELLALLRLKPVKHQVSMRGGSQREDSGLGRVHSRIISVRCSIERTTLSEHTTGVACRAPASL